METTLLKALSFSLALVTHHNYGSRLMNAMDRVEPHLVATETRLKVEALAKYVGELCAIEPIHFKYPPSLYASAAQYIARYNFNLPGWHPLFEHCMGYTEADLLPCIVELHRVYLVRMRSFDTPGYISVYVLRVAVVFICC
jgi:hypothetical protein